jgi:mono/diheme cytochrome c family protein
MKAARVIAATLLVEIAALAVLIASGLYDVSAMSSDPKPVRWILIVARNRSIERHSRGIQEPNVADSSLVAEGFDHYSEMCVECHGAPGIERSEVGEGLYPQPPNLARAAKKLLPRELFWVVKNGIKSTGMPAFGKTHSDQKVWAIAAFIERLTNMTPAEYTTMQKTRRNSEGHMEMKN